MLQTSNIKDLWCNLTLSFLYKCMHSFKTRLGPAGRTVNRWVGRFEPTFGSVMQLTQPEPVKTGDSAEFLV